eukprot:703827-Prymnesium_polylepis.2
MRSASQPSHGTATRDPNPAPQAGTPPVPQTFTCPLCFLFTFFDDPSKPLLFLFHKPLPPLPSRLLAALSLSAAPPNHPGCSVSAKSRTVLSNWACPRPNMAGTTPRSRSSASASSASSTCPTSSSTAAARPNRSSDAPAQRCTATSSASPTASSCGAALRRSSTACVHASQRADSASASMRTG